MNEIFNGDNRKWQRERRERAEIGCAETLWAVKGQESSLSLCLSVTGEQITPGVGASTTTTTTTKRHAKIN